MAADRRLRSLRRREASDQEAGQRVLQERVRRGELDPGLLELLAGLGHPQARWAPPGSTRPFQQACQSTVGLRAWVEALEPYGAAACVRAARAAVTVGLPLVKRPLNPNLRPFLEDLLDGPDGVEAERSLERAALWREWHGRLTRLWRTAFSLRSQRVGKAGLATLEAAQASSSELAAQHAGQAVEEVAEVLGPGGAQVVGDAVRAGLLAWVEERLAC